MIVLIGNAPSSGSSLLSDLLDATEVSMCGEEIGIFSNKYIYDFDKYKSYPLVRSPTSCVYRVNSGVELEWLYTYAFDTKTFIKLVNDASSFNDFSNILSERYSAFRGKKRGAILFEKTPENISCLGEFLGASKKSYFIYVIRNPLNVYASLLNRGFSDYMAISTWLIDVSRYLKYSDHQRVITIRYEDLVNAPFEIVSKLINDLGGGAVSPEEVKQGYENNRYKQAVSIKMKTWSVQGYGKVSNANRTISPQLCSRFNNALELKISSGYAQIFDLQDVSMLDAMKLTGYYDVKVHKSNHEKTNKSFHDTKILYKKWRHDYRQGFAKISDLKSYLCPTEY